MRTSSFKTHILAAITLLLMVATPFVSYAQVGSCGGRIGEFRDLICIIVDIISSLIPFLLSLMLLVFFWGLAKFILHADDAKARSEGRQIMIWGVVGLFVATSLFGILQYLSSNFSFGIINVPPKLPRI